MQFIDRERELERLERLSGRTEGGFAVVYGRRRIGKTRLLLEWCARAGGVYSVADLSAAEIQRRYFAEAIAQRLPGFADVEYRDWRSLLERLARDAGAAGFRGPVVFDELPYLVHSTPELPSVMQRWIDHDARNSRLVVAVAGSSQRMMQGAVLSREAPLFGRAQEVLRLTPVDAPCWHDLVPHASARDLLDLWSAWGGVPRYWELALDAGASAREQVERLVLDPLGPLCDEPDRLLIEELPSAMEARPLLDAIGAGAHRVSEIAGRLGRSATSISRPMQRLIEMGLVRREVPFGETERESKRGLYSIDDPFFRLWFRVVAPHRAQLATGTRAIRLQIFDHAWNALAAQAWEDLCRARLPQLASVEGGPWGPASRWWRGNEPEWDLVSTSIDGERLLLAEVKWSASAPTPRDVDRWAEALVRRPPPKLPGKLAGKDVVHCLFVVERPQSLSTAVPVYDAEDVLFDPVITPRPDARPG